MKTILVSGASGVIGYGILKSLRKGESDYKLIGTSIYNDSVAPAFCDVFERAPPTKDDHYIDWLCETIKKHKVDMIIPGIEIDMLTWNRQKDKIVISGAKILLNNPDLIELCSDKWVFYKKLSETGSKLLIGSRLAGDFESLKKKFGLPFLLKPREGFGSKGIVTVDSEETLARHQNDLGPILMAQPIVGSNEEEYTVSAFFDKGSNLLCLMELKRKLSKEGFTEKAQTTDLAGTQEAILELATLLQPVGPTNFQFRVKNGQLKLLEVNPRISSATSIRAAFGYNESIMSVEYFLNDKVPTQPKIKRGYAVRYVEEKIFYDSHNI